MDLALTPTPTYLRVVVTGALTPMDVEESFAQELAACRQHDLHTILADLRGATIQFASPVTDAYLVSSRLADQHLAAIDAESDAVQLAVVLAAPLGERDRTGARVASTRGLRTLVTTDLAKAYAWLGVEPPAAPEDGAVSGKEHAHD